MQMSRVPDERLRRQFKSDECYDFAIKNRKSVDLEQVTRNRHSVCINKTFDDEWSVSQYAPDDLFFVPDGADKKYCFRRSDATRLLVLGSNPYNDKRFNEATNELLKTIANEWVSLGPALPLKVQMEDIDMKGRCPLWRSDNPFTIYAYACYSGTKFYFPEQVAVMNEPECVGTLYRLYLDSPYQPGVTDNHNIIRQEAVSTCRVVESEPRPSEDDMIYIERYPRLIPIIKKLTIERGDPSKAVVSDAELEFLSNTPELRVDKPMTLYQRISLYNRDYQTISCIA